MIKVWTPQRIRRVREAENRAADHAVRKAAARQEIERSYTPGDARKNALLMLDALGLTLRRRMVARLMEGGAMSLSKLCEPFSRTLSPSLRHIRALERAGIVTTHKKGRVRLCVYNPRALKELAQYFASDRPDLST